MRETNLEDASYFLQRFLRSPKNIASVLPSSRYLADHMFRGLDLADGDVLIEYGPGTGSFTWEVERLRRRGVDIAYLGVEKDPGMHQYLTRRFRHLDFVLGDAADTVAHCAERGLPAATAVISGLPMMLMRSRDILGIVNATRNCLRPDGTFRTFSYVHSYPSRSARRVRTVIQRGFEEFDLSRPVVRNVPPAFLYTGRNPRRTRINGTE